MPVALYPGDDVNSYLSMYPNGSHFPQYAGHSQYTTANVAQPPSTFPRGPNPSSYYAQQGADMYGQQGMYGHPQMGMMGQGTMGGSGMMGGHGGMGGMGGMAGMPGQAGMAMMAPGSAMQNLGYDYQLNQLGYQPETSWDHYRLATEHYGGDGFERGWFDNIVDNTGTFWSARRMKYDDAKESHRRIYHDREHEKYGLEDISSRTLGGAAAFQAFLIWDRDYSHRFRELVSGENRKRFIGLGVGELYSLFQRLGLLATTHTTTHTVRLNEAAEAAAATCKYLYDRYLDPEEGVGRSSSMRHGKSGSTYGDSDYRRHGRRGSDVGRRDERDYMCEMEMRAGMPGTPGMGMGPGMRMGIGHQGMGGMMPGGGMGMYGRTPMSAPPYGMGSGMGMGGMSGMGGMGGMGGMSGMGGMGGMSGMSGMMNPGMGMGMNPMMGQMGQMGGMGGMGQYGGSAMGNMMENAMMSQHGIAHGQAVPGMTVGDATRMNGEEWPVPGTRAYLDAHAGGGRGFWYGRQ